MAIARQGSADLGNDANSGSGGWTPSYTVNAASNLVVIFVTGSYATSGTVQTILSVAYGGTSMSLAGSIVGTATNTRCCALYYLFNPPTGANNFNIMYTGSGGDEYVLAVAADYSGCSTSGLDGTVTTNTSGNTLVTTMSSPSPSISNTGAWVISGCGPGTTNSLTSTGLTKVVQGSAFTLGFIYDSNAAVGATGVHANTYNFSSVSFSEITMAVDPSGGGGAFTASLSESGSASDTVTYTLGISVSISESGSATDTPTAVFGRSVSISEAGSATDTPTAVFGRSVTISEAGSATDTSSGILGLIASIAEAGAAVDTDTDVFGRLVAMVEAGAASDTTNGLPSGAFSGNLSETASAAELLSAVLGIFVNVSEVGGLSDTWTFSSPVPPAPVDPGINTVLINELPVGVIPLSNPMGAGLYNVYVSAAWNPGALITITSANGQASYWQNKNSTRKMWLPFGQLTITNNAATSVRIIISPA